MNSDVIKKYLFIGIVQSDYFYPEIMSICAGCMASVVPVVGSIWGKKMLNLVILVSFTLYILCTPPSGRHNCLWCLIPSSKLSEPIVTRGSFPARSLGSLKADHARFITQGHGNLRVAKNFNKVIGEATLDFPLDNVRQNIYKLLKKKII